MTLSETAEGSLGPALESGHTWGSLRHGSATWACNLCPLTQLKVSSLAPCQLEVLGMVCRTPGGGKDPHPPAAEPSALMIPGAELWWPRPGGEKGPAWKACKMCPLGPPQPRSRPAYLPPRAAVELSPSCGQCSYSRRGLGEQVRSGWSWSRHCSRARPLSTLTPAAPRGRWASHQASPLPHLPPLRSRQPSPSLGGDEVSIPVGRGPSRVACAGWQGPTQHYLSSVTTWGRTHYPHSRIRKQ